MIILIVIKNIICCYKGARDLFLFSLFYFIVVLVFPHGIYRIISSKKEESEERREDMHCLILFFFVCFMLRALFICVFF